MKVINTLLLFLVSHALGATFNNPILWEDLADLEVLRVNDTYYYTSSTMHYSPGAPVLRSGDLVNWEYIGHAVPHLDFGTKYDLTNGNQAYVKGIWASSMKYRPSNGKWYWIGCIEFSTTYIYTASAPQGPWTKAGTINTCYYDAGLLIDDDDTMYVAYGSSTINVAQLSADGLSQVSTRAVFTGPNSMYIEGSRFYKRNGKYYILVTKPANEEYVLQASSVFGTYSMKGLAQSVASPVSGSGYPHQGGIVDTPDGEWYYMSFIDAYPGGRIPALAPITWGSDGFPTLTTVNGAWGASYDYPEPAVTVPSPQVSDSFSGTALGPQWEWNHNPDTSGFTVNNGLTLKTVTVTNDLYAARNTLTHRILGPSSSGTIKLDVSSMANGDKTGLAMLRDYSAYIAVVKSSGSYRVSMVNGLSMGGNWNTISTGSEAGGAALSGTPTSIWLRASADIAPGGSHTARFSYSTDGSQFVNLGNTFTMNTTYYFFMGYRFGIFNFASQALGGSVKVNFFQMALN